MSQLIEHKVIGKVLLKRNIRSRKIKVTISPQGVVVTFPFLCPASIVMSFLDKNARVIRKRFVDVSLKKIMEEEKIQKRAEIRQQKEDLFLSSLNGESYGGFSQGEGSDPERNIFSFKVPYSSLTKRELGMIKERARIILKERLEYHSARMNSTMQIPDPKVGGAISNPFSYNRLSIKDNSTNLGSCSSRRNINLSMHLIRLPKLYCDYVIVHELCHLVYMNHSKYFYDLVSRALGTDARKCRDNLLRLERSHQFLRRNW